MTNDLKVKRNNTLDFFKCIACFGILFMHTNGGSMIDSFIVCLSRFGIPLFFMISGYFVVVNDKNKQVSVIFKKIRRILIMFLISAVIYGIVRFLIEPFVFGNKSIDLLNNAKQLVSMRNIMQCLVFNQFPLGGTLWFLLALIYCYLIWALVEKLNASKVMYILIPIIIIIHIVSRAYLLKTNLIPEEINIVYYRNWLFMGLPFFALGNFIRKYQHEITNKVSNLVLIVLMIVGLAVSCIERLFVPLELFFGTVVVVLAVFIFSVKNPNSINIPIINLIGAKYFMVIYLMHPLVNDFTQHFYKRISNINTQAVLREINPLVVLVVCICLAFVYDRLITLGDIKYAQNKN